MKEIKTKPPNKAYEDGWDRIFKADNSNPWCSKVEINWPESENRMNIVGQNGNDGLHYNKLCSICGKELEKVTECAWTSCEKWLNENTTT